MDALTWAYVIGAILVIGALAAFWRQLLRAVLLLAGLGVVGLIAWAFAAQATATQQVATAATVSAAGSTAGNVAVTLLAGLLLLAVLGGGGYIAVLRWQLRRARPANGQRWLPGHNARWGLGSDGGQSSSGEDALGMLVQIEVLRALRDLRGAASAPRWAALPGDEGGGYADDAGGDPGPLWW